MYPVNPQLPSPNVIGVLSTPCYKTKTYIIKNLAAMCIYQSPKQITLKLYGPIVVANLLNKWVEDGICNHNMSEPLQDIVELTMLTIKETIHVRESKYNRSKFGLLPLTSFRATINPFFCKCLERSIPDFCPTIGTCMWTLTRLSRPSCLRKNSSW